MRSRADSPSGREYIGGLLVVASLVGIGLGTFVADLVYKLTKKAYLLVAAFAVLCAIPLGATGILDPDYKSSLVYLFGASLMMSMVLGPCNTITANVIPANRRATAYAAFIFLIHLFGDISSLILLGWISDLFGKPAVTNSPIGKLRGIDRAASEGWHQFDDCHALGGAGSGGGIRLVLDRIAVSCRQTRIESGRRANPIRADRLFSITEVARTDRSMPEDRQSDLERDQNDDGDLERLHAIGACLVDQKVIDVADGLQLAADALLPVAQVKSPARDVEDSGKVMVADQFQGVVNPFEEAGRLDLEFSDLTHGVVVKPPEERNQRPALLGSNQSVGGFEPVVQTVVDLAKLKELDVGEFDHFECIGAVRIDDHAGCPVEDDQVIGRVG